MFVPRPHARRALASVFCFATAFHTANAQTVSDPGRAIGWSQSGPLRSAEDCPPGRTPLMILGSYHMSNPGLDGVNTRADDVRSPPRQAEIADVVKALGRFRPSKVALESPFKGSPLPALYAEYLQGRYELAADEREQLGFRIAKEAGLASVSPVDYPMFMSGFTPNEIADGGISRAHENLIASTTPLSHEEQLLRASTVGAYLAHRNADTSVIADASEYASMLLPDTTTVALYARADILANWYKRNLRIFANLTRFTDLGKDRVLLIIGAGHIHILSDFALTSSYYCLVSPLDYLPH